MGEFVSSESIACACACACASARDHTDFLYKYHLYTGPYPRCRVAKKKVKVENDGEKLRDEADPEGEDVERVVESSREGRSRSFLVSESNFAFRVRFSGHVQGGVYRTSDVVDVVSFRRK